MSKINQEIHGKVDSIITEMNAVVKGRYPVIHGIWVGRIGGLHVLMRGPGGTGKSMLSREMVSRIEGAVRFERALDETTDPSEVFGAPNIKKMGQDGVVERVTAGMLPEATDAMLDEFFNGNVPLLHSIMPILNERLYHNGSLPQVTPLRQCLMGTNKLNLEPDLAALFDRVHIRFDVDYINDRDDIRDMVSMAIARLSAGGRGATTNIAETKTTVTLDELDIAFKESLHLDVPDPVLEMFLDIKEELSASGIEVSSRRLTDGFNATLANAWLRNHETVQPGDLDILANMFWTHEDQISEARNIILASTSPGEKVGLDLLDALDELKKEVRDVEGDDEERERRTAVEAVRNAERLLGQAEAEKVKALEAGSSVQRLDEVIAKADAFKIEVGRKIFGFSESEMRHLANV